MSGVGYETPWHQVTDPENQPPLKLGGRQSDYLTGYTAAAAAMCALYSRKSNGAGQHVDVSQWLSMVSMIRPNIGFYFARSARLRFVPAAADSRAKPPPSGCYPCKDGWVSFSAGTDRFWRGAKKAMGDPEWMDTELFGTILGRAVEYRRDRGRSNRLAIYDIPELRHSRGRRREHVPCFPVHSPAEVAGNEQYKARKFFLDLDHPAAREVRMPGAPCKFSRTPWRIVRGAPRLGEHNDKDPSESLPSKAAIATLGGISREKAVGGNSRCRLRLDLCRPARDRVAGRSGSRRNQNRDVGSA